jgi:hypothetical protein
MDINPHSAFFYKDLKKASLWQNLLGLKPKGNAVTEINNLLASRDLCSISPDDIRQISTEYNIDLRKKFLGDLLTIYKKYLLFCLTDKYLSNQEVKNLKCLQDALSLTDNEAAKIHQVVTCDVYKMEVEKAIEDGRLSEEEKSFLRKIQRNLNICDSMAEEIYQESANGLLKKVMDEALSDNLLTDEEEKELEEIRKSLNVDVALEGTARGNYEKCKLFWQIENGKLPLFDTDLFLDESEPCHFCTKAEWLVQKITVKQRENHELKSRIAKGIYWKSENKNMKPELEDIWATMDNGKIYITRKKLILAGNEGDKDVLLQDIIDFTAYQNGINLIGKEKTIFLQFRDHVDVFAMILGKAISNFYTALTADS